MTELFDESSEMSNIPYGWIKVYRILLDNPYMRKPHYRAVWLELLLRARHPLQKAKKVLFKGKQHQLQLGQLTFGLKQMEKWTGVPRSSISRILKKYLKEGMIEMETSNEFTLVTIVNWHKYQSDKKQVRGEQDSSDNTAKTLKENKEINNKFFSKRYI